MTISEPATMLTDYLLAALLLAWGIRLRRTGAEEIQRSRLLWAAGFFAAATAALLGGTFHGFRPHLGITSAAIFWKASLYATGTASWLMLSAVMIGTTTRRWRATLLIFAGGKFALLAVWLMHHSEFSFVIFDYAISMMGILFLQIGGWRRYGTKSAPWMVGGILVGVVAAGIQIGRVAPHPHFNHNDLFHVVQMMCFHLFYRGGRWLVDSRS